MPELISAAHITGLQQAKQVGSEQLANERMTLR